MIRKINDLETVSNVLPKDATHVLRLDILNKDASVKRIEVAFCGGDQWSECMPGMLNIVEMFEGAFYDLIMRDKQSVGCKYSIINKKTNNQLPIIFQPLISKPECFIDLPKTA